MGFLTKVTSFFGGSLFKEIKDGVMSYFPPDMSPQEKAEAELKIQQFLHAKQMEANRVLNESAAALDKRIAEQEGTAKDLLALPVIGRVLLFARGAQRPVWGFATIWMDFQWFFGGYTFSEQQNTALIIINTLVLGFLFGERAAQNVLPKMLEYLGKRKEGSNNG